MTILRICPDNVIDRALTLTANSTVSASYPVTNIQKDTKAFAHRTAVSTTAVQIEATFTLAETFNFIWLLGNYSPSATVRVRIYTNSGDATPVLDTGALSACPASAVTLRGFTAAQAASAYAYGGGQRARLFFTQTSGKWIVINISDASGLQGYVETSRIVCGKYWSPQINPEFGVGLTYMDASEHKTTAASDLRTTIGTRKRKLKFNLRKLREVDRSQVIDLFTSNGKGYPFWASVLPADAIAKLERDYEGWWKLSDINEIEMEFVDMFNINWELLEM